MWCRRWHDDGDESLDNTHLMRMAGRFARRVRASAAARGIPVVDCKADERKHRIAEEYLREHTVGPGVFLILVARAPATVWKVSRTSAGKIRNLEKTRQFAVLDTDGSPVSTRDVRELQFSVAERTLVWAGKSLDDVQRERKPAP